MSAPGDLRAAAEYRSTSVTPGADRSPRLSAQRPTTQLPKRKARPRVRIDGAAYFVTWNLHRDQPDLAADERTLVADTLLHFNGIRYHLHAWVVMNDHVHVVVQPAAEFSLDAIVTSWRSFAANMLMRQGQRHKPVWLRDGYDRVALPDGELAEKVRYVKANPWRRWPELAEYEWVGPAEEADGRGDPSAPTS